MRRPSPATPSRPHDLTDPDDPATLYVRSYLLIRTVVGVIGIVLPVALIAGGNWSEVRVGGSLSSYYHSAMQDVYVGGLCLIAVLLATYLSGQPRTWDFRLSLGAGLALLVVVFFPVGRPGVPAGTPLCGSTPAPAGCSPVQQLFGEELTEQIHLVAAAGCFLLLAVLSFLFARRERVHGDNLGAAGLHRLLGAVLLLAIAAAVLGRFRPVHLGPVPLLYAAETAAIWAFGASWLLAGRELWLRLLRPKRRPAVPGCPDPRDAPPHAAPAAPDGVTAGWYGDPYPAVSYLRSERWFDGRGWTSATRPIPGRSRGAGLVVDGTPIPWGFPPPSEPSGDPVGADR